MRDKQIDLLRFIGLSFLILGHVEPPGWLFQLRNFNVAAVVIASAMALAQGHIKDDYWPFVWKRIKRLAFPAWIFLTFYFFFLWLTGIDPKKLAPDHIWNNYIFSNDGGFMWIIRIFLLVAMVAPFAFRLNEKIASNKQYFGLLLCGYIAYEGLIYLLHLGHSNIWSDLGISFVGYAFGYGIIFALGLRLNRLSPGELADLARFMFGIFAALCLIYYVREGHVVSTQHYKYPPSAYYVSYAVGMSILIWRSSGLICAWLAQCPPVERIVMFIAQNTLWIYLWHTLLIQITYRMNDQGFLAKYLVVYSLSALTTFGQVDMMKRWVLPRVADERTKKNLKAIFTG